MKKRKQKEKVSASFLVNETIDLLNKYDDKIDVRIMSLYLLLLEETIKREILESVKFRLVGRDSQGEKE